MTVTLPHVVSPWNTAYNPMNVFTLAMSSEWYGLYNPAGFLVYEGSENLNSSIDYAFIANLIGFGISILARTVDENWLDGNLGYPERLEDVVWSGTWK